MGESQNSQAYLGATDLEVVDKLPKTENEIECEDKDVGGCDVGVGASFSCNKNEELTVNCLQNHVRTFDNALNHPRCSSTLLLTFKTKVELPATPVPKVDDPTFFSGGGIFSFTLANTSDSQANPRLPLITNTYETEVQLPSTLTVVLLSQKISWASRAKCTEDYGAVRRLESLQSHAKPRECYSASDRYHSSSENGRPCQSGKHLHPKKRFESFSQWGLIRRFGNVQSQVEVAIAVADSDLNVAVEILMIQHVNKQRFYGINGENCGI
ncbi:hypothetical protein L1887_18187 [Cichorium endivia]|nr:hypothetical protein L1887_18187 [Cichorium endivia]